VVAVFEVSSPSSFRTDTVVKVLEYAAVPTIRHYVILDSTRPSAMVFERARANEPWTASKPTTNDIIRFPELQIEIPISEFYEDIAFEAHDVASAASK
jgi:Uma2 family endonuclease